MPPKSRKRAKTSKSENLAATSSSAPQDLSGDTRSSPKLVSQANVGKGLLSLPLELLLQILGHFREIREVDIISNPRYLGERDKETDYKSRFITLRGLSQTCRQWRQFFLPLLWEHFEVCIIWGKLPWYQELGNAMMRKSEGMLQCEHLWPYVRIVTVCFTRYQTSVVIPPFVQLLKALPQVQTLQIPHTHSLMTTALKDAFQGIEFPSIQKAIIPDCAHEILRCCSSIRSLTCNEGIGGRLVSALIHAGCSNLSEMKYIDPGTAALKRLAKRSPPLSLIRLRRAIHPTLVAEWPSFRSLKVIEIDYWGDDVKASDTEVDTAKKVLTACTEHTPTIQKRRTRGNNNTDISTTDTTVDLKMVKIRYCRGSYYFQCLPLDYESLKEDVFTL